MDKTIRVFKPMEFELKIKMSGHDWSSFHDTYYEATNKSLTQEECSYFPEETAFFTWKENMFMWRLLVGQGSHCQLTYFTVKPEHYNGVYKKLDVINTDIKFLTEKK